MNKKIYIRACYSKLLSLLLLVCLTSCSVDTTGGGSTDSGGTQVATGTIIGFGSVVVNGIKFSRKAGLADDRVKLRFENNTSAGEGSLRVGMIVKVSGKIDAATDTGEYESIEFQPEIRGPLDSNGVDAAVGTLTIMGRTIQVENNTSFESIRDLAEIDGELQAGRHPELEISGNMDNSTGILHATRVARKAVDYNAAPGKPVQIKGVITTVNAAAGATNGSFTIDGVTVNFAAAALGPNTIGANIAAGVVVEVTGTLSADGSVITATRVEKKNAVDAGVNSFVCVKGTSTGSGDNKSFTINGPNGAITINASAALFQNGTAMTTTTAGTTLEVEGNVQPDGSIAAGRVYIETDRSVRLEGNALAGAFSANTLTLNGVPVAISATTRLVSNNGQALDLTKIAAGDHLQIAGLFDNITNRVTASQVQLTSASSVTFIQGPVTAITSSNFTLIGMITVDATAVAQTQSFSDNRTGNHTKIDGAAAFILAVTDGLAEVKATGTVSGTTLIATKLELEQAQ